MSHPEKLFTLDLYKLRVPFSVPSVRTDGTQRLYAVDSAPPREVDIWLERFRRFWNQRLDALGTELARGERERHEQGQNAAGTPSVGSDSDTESEEDT
jgi:hypothetical protein